MLLRSVVATSSASTALSLTSGTDAAMEMATSAERVIAAVKRMLATLSGLTKLSRVRERTRLLELVGVVVDKDEFLLLPLWIAAFLFIQL